MAGCFFSKSQVSSTLGLLIKTVNNCLKFVFFCSKRAMVISFVILEDAANNKNKSEVTASKGNILSRILSLGRL